MNSSEAAAIRQVASQASPEAQAAHARATGVHRHVERLTRDGVDLKSVAVETFGKNKQPIRQGDKLTLAVVVTAIHEVMDEQTGEVKDHVLDLGHELDNGYVLHLGRFAANLF